MQQYFSKKEENGILYINKEDIHHIKNVMRINIGENVIVNYNNISYLCTLTSYETAKIEKVYKDKQDSISVFAYIPIVNEEKISFIIEKGTEMGVSEFIPVNFSHSKFKLSKEKEIKKLERWNKICKEASEQSRRVFIPKVRNIIDVKDIETVNGVNILCSLDTSNVKSIKEVLNSDTLCDKISLVFGPEGGISKEEEDILSKKGFTKTSLGDNVLRTETVIICLMMVINYIKG